MCVNKSGSTKQNTIPYNKAYMYKAVYTLVPVFQGNHLKITKSKKSKNKIKLCDVQITYNFPARAFFNLVQIEFCFKLT